MMKKYIITLCLIAASVLGFAQSKVEGTVISAIDKSPVAGATVIVENTTIGAITDGNGKYVLTNVPDGGSLEFSMIGFKTLVEPVNRRSQVNVTLEVQTMDLDEVVVIGYGAVKKSDLTSAISTVKADEITQMSTGNAMSAIQGKVNGVQVQSAGGPGATPTIIIRGVSTVNGSDPLYVVDGMPVGTNINFLNSEDIESMEVLKDASATSIYGTRGSNGVILITTKKGKAGKTQFTFSSKTGIQMIDQVDMAGAGEYEQVFKTRYTNDGASYTWVGKDGWSDSEGTDWWDATLNNYSVTHSYNFGFSGGDEKLTFSANMGYYYNNSQFDYGYWDKFNLRINMDYKFSDMVKAGIDMTPYVESWDNTPSVWNNMMSMDPTTDVMLSEDLWTDNEYSNYSRSNNNQAWNPVASVARMDNRSRKYGFIGTPYVAVEPIKGLIIRSQMGVQATIQRQDVYSPEFYIDLLEKNDVNSIARYYDETLNWNWANTANYMTTYKKHSFNFMGGFTMEQYNTYNLDGSSDAIPNNSDALQEVSAGTTNQQASGTSSTYSLMSYLGRVMYNYDSKYYATITTRVDGSSKFPTDNQYAIFPSVSLAWRLKSESFLKDVDFINELKLRGGWGRVGNQSIDDDATLTLLTSADYTFGTSSSRTSGTTISSVGNSSLVWETVEDYSIGFDARFLDNRLSVVGDVYVKKSSDMLYQKQHIYAAGYPDWNCQVWSNVGSMQAKGWELSFQWNDKIKDLTYNVGLNLSHVKNTALVLSGDGTVLTGSFNGDYIIQNADGEEISQFYGYQADGIFQNWAEVYAHTDEYGNLLQPNAVPGDIRFANLNNDSVIDENDKTYIGSAMADLNVGLNISLAYRNFDFVANFYGTFGNDIFNTTKEYYSGSNGANVYAGTLAAAWSGEGTSNDIPRLSASDLNGNYATVSSFYVEDGSYFRCKLLQLGYTVPKNKIAGLDVRVSLSAQNLFTFTNYSGLDPESASTSVLAAGIDWKAYPNAKTFLLGIDFKF